MSEHRGNAGSPLDDLVEADHLPLIVDRARDGFRRKGRGAVVVLRTAVRADGTPDRTFHGRYLSRAEVALAAADPELRVAPDVLGTIDAYDPAGEAVALLVGRDEVTRPYRIRNR